MSGNRQSTWTPSRSQGGEVVGAKFSTIEILARSAMAGTVFTMAFEVKARNFSDLENFTV